MMPEELDASLLYVFLFGPGFGETVAIRVPPDHWIVIDRCRVAHRAASLHVLERYGGRTSCAVLTHPHRDHYPGFSQILDYQDWAVVGCCDLQLEGEDVDLSADPERRRGNELDQVLAGITDHWRRNDDKRWWTWRHSYRQIGEARLTSLHPTQQFARDHPQTNPNNLSSAMLLEWRRVRLLLGADVENPHWEANTRTFRSLKLNMHAAMKTPHHASEGALHTNVLTGPENRCWLVTPYNRGEKLPNFANGYGPHVMLRHVPELYLTGLPVAHDRQGESPCCATRSQLLNGETPRPLSFELPGGLAGDTLDTRDDLSCYLVSQFDESGQGRVIAYGPGTVRVTER